MVELTGLERMVVLTNHVLRRNTLLLSQQTASALTSAPPSASATAGATSSRAFGLPSSSDFQHPSTEYAGLAPGSHHYSPPGGTNFREEDYRTSEQRPLFKPERHTFDATPKTEPWTPNA